MKPYTTPILIAVIISQSLPELHPFFTFISIFY